MLSLFDGSDAKAFGPLLLHHWISRAVEGIFVCFADIAAVHVLRFNVRFRPETLQPKQRV